MQIIQLHRSSYLEQERLSNCNNCNHVNEKSFIKAGWPLLNIAMMVSLRITLTYARTCCPSRASSCLILAILPFRGCCQCHMLSTQLCTSWYESMGEVPSGTRSGIKKVVHELPWGWLHHSKPVTLCVTTLMESPQ